MSSTITDSNVATEASTFVVAYACHKVFAPLRMLMTITCTPLIVRKLRKVGFLKEPLKQQRMTLTCLLLKVISLISQEQLCSWQYTCVSKLVKINQHKNSQRLLQKFPVQNEMNRETSLHCANHSNTIFTLHVATCMLSLSSLLNRHIFFSSFFSVDQGLCGLFLAKIILYSVHLSTQACVSHPKTILGSTAVYIT